MTSLLSPIHQSGSILITLQQTNQAQENDQIQRDLVRVSQEIYQQMRKNEERVAQINKKGTQFFEFKNLIFDSFELQQKKTNSTTQRVLGKAASSKRLLKQSLQSVDVNEINQNLKFRSSLQDRDVRNLLYNTIKTLVLNKLIKQNHAHLIGDDQTVPYDIFRYFSID